MNQRIRVLGPWIILLLMFWTVFAEANPRRTLARLRATIETLTQADWQGRATGDGAVAAAQWLEEQMEKAGLEPAGEDGYRVRVSVPTRMSRAATFQLGERTFALDHEFEVLSWSDSAHVDGPLIFAGYGISAPHLGWDDYADLDVKDAAVLVLTGLPTKLEGTLNTANEHLLTLESKSAVALAKKARAVIFINDPRSHGHGEGQRPDVLGERRTQRALDGIAVVRSRLDPLQDELKNLGIDFTSDSPTFSTPVRLHVELKRTFQDAVNLVGKVRGHHGPSVLLAAHYDGLPEESTEPGYTGADDNASGVAIVLEVAQRLVKTPAVNQTTYIIFHDAEELGLHGARRTATWLRDQGVMGHIINLDMVGRLRDPGLRVHAMGEDCLRVRKLAEQDMVKIVCDQLKGSPSDHLPYVNTGFSAVSLTTGRSVDYHTHRDRIEHLNFSGMVVIADLLESMARPNL